MGRREDLDTQGGWERTGELSRQPVGATRAHGYKNTGFKRSHGQEQRIQTFSRLKTQLTSHGTMKRGARLERAVRGKNKEIEGTKRRVARGRKRDRGREVEG